LDERQTGQPSSKIHAAVAVSHRSGCAKWSTSGASAMEPDAQQKEP
jgi:hypothetical protein